MEFDEVIAALRALANPDHAAGMAHFGIDGADVLGIPIPQLRALARRIGRDHPLALRLWETGIHEARLLAAFTDDPKQVTPEQMEHWAAGFDTWDVCDQVCGCLFDKTPYAYDFAISWAERPEEFVRRAGFVMMAQLAVHDKKAPDTRFEAFYPLILKHATDERNFVRKAINWAVRQIGKRSTALNASAIALAQDIHQLDSKAARWVAADALRELTREEIRARFKRP